MAVNGILFSMFVMVVIAIIIASIYFSPDIPVTNQEAKEVVEEVDAQMACPEEGEVVSPDEFYAVAEIVEPYRFDIRPADKKPKRIRCIYAIKYANQSSIGHYDSNADLMESMEALKNHLIDTGQGLVQILENNPRTFKIGGLGCVIDDTQKRLEYAYVYLI